MEFKGDCKPFLGSRASQQMHLLLVLKENILPVELPGIEKEDYAGVRKGHVMEEFSDAFTGEGSLEDTLYLDIDQSVTLGLSIRKELKCSWPIR